MKANDGLSLIFRIKGERPCFFARLVKAVNKYRGKDK